MLSLLQGRSTNRAMPNQGQKVVCLVGQYIWALKCSGKSAQCPEPPTLALAVSALQCSLMLSDAAESISSVVQVPASRGDDLIILRVGNCKESKLIVPAFWFFVQECMQIVFYPPECAKKGVACLCCSSMRGPLIAVLALSSLLLSINPAQLQGAGMDSTASLCGGPHLPARTTGGNGKSAARWRLPSGKILSANYQ